MPKDDHLGTGLEAIFGPDLTNIIDDIQNNSEMADQYGRKVTLRIDEIRMNPYQPRHVFDETKLNELADSIREHGVFTPVLVRKSAAGYELIAGERRVKASKIAGREEIPAIVVDFNDEQMMEISLLENIQREDLNAIEEANAYKQLMDNMGYTQEELSKKIGKSREYIANSLRLLKLPKFIQKLVEEGTLSMGQARPLITIESESDARKIADKTIKDGLSVRAVENLVRTFKTPSMHYEPVRQSDNHILDVQKNLQRKLGTRVRISGSSINISYSSTADLNRILELIGYEETE
jgi:ParB family chromosome partitioning protein